MCIRDRPITTTCPADISIPACSSSQSDIELAYTNWVTGFSAIEGGCAIVATNITDIPALNYQCGQAISLSFDFIASDECGRQAICSSNFNVEEPESLCVACLEHETIPTMGEWGLIIFGLLTLNLGCLLYTSPSPRDATLSRMPSSA